MYNTHKCNYTYICVPYDVHYTLQTIIILLSCNIGYIFKYGSKLKHKIIIHSRKRKQKKK